MQRHPGRFCKVNRLKIFIERIGWGSRNCELVSEPDGKHWYATWTPKLIVIQGGKVELRIETVTQHLKWLPFVETSSISYASAEEKLLFQDEYNGWFSSKRVFPDGVEIPLGGFVTDRFEAENIGYKFLFKRGVGIVELSMDGTLEAGLCLGVLNWRSCFEKS